MLEDLFVRREEIVHEMKEANGQRLVDLQDSLAAIDKALADPKRLALEDGDFVPTGDPLVDSWELALSRGETPDLEAGRPKKAKAPFTVLDGGGKK